MNPEADKNCAELLSQREAEVRRLLNVAYGLQDDVESLQQQRAEQMLRVVQLKAVTVLAFSYLSRVLDDEDCRFDHEGYCHTHSVSRPCEVAAAREFLRTSS